MSVPRQEAAQQLHDMVLEADAYATLHNLNFLGFLDNKNDENRFLMVCSCNNESLAQYLIAAYRNMNPAFRPFVADAIESMSPPKPVPKPKKPRVSWSLMWGLFTKYV